jgi:hypothetical protein
MVGLSLKYFLGRRDPTIKLDYDSDGILERWDNNWLGKQRELRKPVVSVYDRDIKAEVEPLAVYVTTTWLDRLSVMTERGERLNAARKLQYLPGVRRDMPAHTHAGCAYLRADASKFIDVVSKKLGSRRYDISIAARESRRGIAGTRAYRTPKDLLSNSIHTPLQWNDLVTMVDTDGHLDLATLASYAGHDMLLYTLAPEGLSGRGPESSWRFVSEDLVVEDVAGGATYQQRVWDWGKDLYVMSSWFMTYIYDPIVWNIGPSRNVVLLLKARTIYLPLCVCEWLLPGLRSYQPSRMEVEKRGKYLVGMFGAPGQRKVQLLNTALPDVDHVEVGPTDWLALEVMSKIPNPDVKSSKASLRSSDVERYLRAQGVRPGAGCLYSLADYFSEEHRPISGVSYQSRKGLVTETGVSAQHVIAPGPVPPGVSPAVSENNSAMAIEERIVNVANTESFPVRYMEYGSEFAKLVVPDRVVGKTVPVSYEQVADQQSRPSQRKRRGDDLKHLALNQSALQTSAFMKMDAGPSVGHPRSINQVPVHQTTTLSMYTMAAKGHFKRHCKRWYGPGKDPVQMGLAIQNLFRKQGELDGGDYSRMDGRTSVGYREHVFEPIYLRLFGKEREGELSTLLKRERRATVVMRNGGARAETTGANLSGSPVTTDLNCVDAAFNEYAARRDAGETPEQAYANLGLYFGDDSVFSAKIATAVIAVSERLGMRMTLEEKVPNAPAGRVVFLSRVYPDIQTSIASYPCMIRALRKMRVATPGKGATERELSVLRVLKGEAALLVNGHVPIIGPYAAVLAASGSAVTVRERENALNRNGDLRWQLGTRAPTTVLSGSEVDLFVASIARDLCIPPEEVRRMDAELRRANTLTDLMPIRLAGWEVSLPDWAVWV